MKFLNWNIGTRLGVAFGVIIALMLVLFAVGINRLNAVSSITNQVANVEWAKVEAAMSANALTRANAQRTNELFIAADAEHVERILKLIDGNKGKITESLETLDRLIYTPKGRALLDSIKQDRAAYVASFSKVIKLFREGDRDGAEKLMISETLAIQDRLLDQYKGMADLQKELTTERVSEAQAAVSSGTIALIVLSAIAVVAAAVLAFFITRSITRPLKAAVTVARNVAAGNLSARIEVTGQDETGQLLQALKEMDDSLLRIIAQTRQGVDAIATASGQIATGNLDLSSRTEQQAGSLEETASSMEELTSTVRQNADNALQANQLASRASDIAASGGQVVADVVETMQSISESAGKIAEIISVIDGIAFQTNILALNAAVEAARAGEQGRGFAVVATEVRNLAQRSANAAKEIKSLIGLSVDRVDAGAALVEQAGATMDEIVQSVKRVSDIMSDIASATREQASGIEQVNRAISEMDQATQQNATLVEEAAAAAASLDEQAAALSHTVSHFKLGEDQVAAAPKASAPVIPLERKRNKAPALPSLGGENGRHKRVANSRAGSPDEWEAF